MIDSNDMLAKKSRTIIGVHNDEVWWISDSSAARDRQWFRLPLEQLLSDEDPTRELPEWLQGHTHSLCIFPDHWFGSECYPFQSNKPSLIEPFLERKLSNAYPGQQNIRDFFSYRHISKDGEKKLNAVFLQENLGYDLFDALQRLNHRPERMTSPAFIWEERLQSADSDFKHLGTLLIHHTGNECQLFFYFQGDYLFSRSVILGDSVDGIGALVFEINQSLYMFSQKAKSELDRVYVVCNTPEFQAGLGDALGREVLDLSTLTGHQDEGEDIPGLAPLNNLVQWSRIHRNDSYFSIVQREMKRTLEWRPVLLTGIALGLILFLTLVGENIFLRNLRNDENSARQSIEISMAEHDNGKSLAEHAGALNQVLVRATQYMFIDAAYRLPAAFPSPVHFMELNLDLTSSPTLELAAMVHARDTNELTILLTQVVSLVNGNFKNIRPFSIRDIDIRLDQLGLERKANRYRISFQLELT